MDTAIILTKGVCTAGAACLLTLSGSLGQWTNTDVGPSTIEWVIILSSSFGAGLAAAGGFLSSSFGNYIKARNGVDISVQQQQHNEPSK